MWRRGNKEVFASSALEARSSRNEVEVFRYGVRTKTRAENLQAGIDAKMFRDSLDALIKFFATGGI